MENVETKAKEEKRGGDSHVRDKRFVITGDADALSVLDQAVVNNGAKFRQMEWASTT